METMKDEKEKEGNALAGSALEKGGKKVVSDIAPARGFLRREV